MKSTGARCSNELRWLDLKIGHCDSSPGNGHQHAPLTIIYKQCLGRHGGVSHASFNELGKRNGAGRGRRLRWNQKPCSVSVTHCPERHKLEIVDQWSTRTPPALTAKMQMTCVTLTYSPENGTWHIVPSWVVFVPHMNIIHKIGNVTAK